MEKLNEKNFGSNFLSVGIVFEIESPKDKFIHLQSSILEIWVGAAYGARIFYTVILLETDWFRVFKAIIPEIAVIFERV